MGINFMVIFLPLFIVMLIVREKYKDKIDDFYKKSPYIKYIIISSIFIFTIANLYFLFN